MRKCLWVVLGLMFGCGGEVREEEPGSAAAMTCSQNCARATAAKCASQPGDCAERCEQQIANTPPRCIAVVSAYASCLSSAVFSCSSQGLAEAQACAGLLAAWQECEQPGQLDASVSVGLSCTPLATDASCDLCLKAKCCSALSGCTGACYSLLACSQSCQAGDNACSATCQDTYGAGVAGAQQIFACMASECTVDCAAELE